MNNNGYHLELDDGLWLFYDKLQALQATELIFKEFVEFPLIILKKLWSMKVL